jgi:hypothetical protein
MRKYKKCFTMEFPDPTASNGIAKIKFDPTFDKIPSTKELVNTRDLGWQYWNEVLNKQK